MRILAIDTASNVATAAIVEDDKLLGEFILNHKKTHSQKIMPVIDELLTSCELSVEEIDLFAAANGPGSFTGLRIGVATVKGLAHATGKPVVGINALEGLAWNVAGYPGTVVALMDARREQVYTAAYRWDGEALETVQQACVLPVKELLERQQQRCIFVGDGAVLHQELIQKSLGGRAVIAPGNQQGQRASSVAALALQKAKRGLTESYLTLEPFYLRKSQAEQEYEKKAGKETK